jgi:hypothetical protein
VITYHCETCGAQFPPAEAPPAGCPICEDARQWVPEDGQRWLTAEELSAGHRHEIRRDLDYDGVGVEPYFAIGQRALLVPLGEEFVLWDCVPLVDEEAAAEIERRGGLAAIAISHPHYYTGMADWAERLDARILLHEADREWITRPTERVELWSGDRLAVDDDHELVRLGGHFEGGTVCLWRGGAGGAGALLSGDVVQVVADRDWVSFMRSYPNLVPLAAREVARIRDALAELEFERLYGAFWHSVVAEDARAKALRSAERYLAALA